MALLQRLRNIDWIDVWLWVFRVVIILGVVIGITRKLFFGAGTTYDSSDWIDFFISGLSQGGLYALIALGYTCLLYTSPSPRD